MGSDIPALHSPAPGVPASRALPPLQRLLLALVAVACAGTIVELVLAGHFDDLLQWIPFVLAGFGGVTAVAVRTRATPRRVRALRLAMVAAALGGGAGTVLHAVKNYAFARETDATASTGALLVEAVTGANPLLAPGILVLVAVLGWVATGTRWRSDYDGAGVPSSGRSST